MSLRSLRPLLLLLLLGSGFVAFAQDEDDAPALSKERLQEIKTQKVAFVTQRLSLSPEEAQKFWPVYDQYDQEVENVRKDMRAMRKDVRSTTLTEAQAAKLLDDEVAAHQRELDIRKRYVGEFKKTIGAVKTVALARAERDFNRELLRRVRDRIGGGRGGEQH